jgi:hypothetical protein
MPEEDPMRWMVLFSFSSLTFMNAATCVLLSPVISEAE